MSEDKCPHCGADTEPYDYTCNICDGLLVAWLCFECNWANDAEAWPVCEHCQLDQEEYLDRDEGIPDVAQDGPGGPEGSDAS